MREYGTNGKDGTDGKPLKKFRLFRPFRLFRILSSTWRGAAAVKWGYQIMRAPAISVLGLKANVRH
jgi:hypothetical protein